MKRALRLILEDRVLSVILFAVAVFAMIQLHPPLIIKVAVVVGAYVLAIHWIYQHSPFAARWIVSTTLLVIFAIIRGLMSASSGRRRR